MSTDRLPAATNIGCLQEFADSILDGRPTIKTRDLAEVFQLDYHVIKRAAADGVLPVVRVSPRRIVVTRSGLIEYLARVNGIQAGSPQ